MFSEPPVLVGLEIGTSKICAAIGEENERGEFKLLGIGQARSRGVRKGEIIDPVKAQEDVRTALGNAEDQAHVAVGNLFLGVTGRHIEGFNNVGMHPVASDDRLVSDQDIADAAANAKAITLPAEHTILHTIRQRICIDGVEVSETPAGMLGHKVEAHVHVIHGNSLRIRNSENLVRALSIEVNQAVFNGLANAQAVLTPEDKENGALVIDIGGGTTEFVFQQGQAIRHSGVFAVGGDHISNDIALGLKINLGIAESLKIQHGHALVSADCRGRTVPLAEGEQVFAEHSRQVSLEHLRRIMSVRLQELFELIAERCAENCLLDEARAGVFISGGGSHIPGIETLAQRVFRLPATVATCRNITGNSATLAHPEFATAVGIARYGGMRLRGRPRPRFNFRDVFPFFR
jgi:cell division protein FtsA